MEGQTMALRQGNECFTKWTHVESGQVVSRRLHRIVLQTPDGDVRTITGDKLPDSIQTWSGYTHRGVNLARALLSPKSAAKQVLKQAPRLPAEDGWWLTREARRRLAALRQALECSTRLDHIENGPPLHRQVRRIEVQTSGRLYTYTGKSLPVFIGIATGQGFKDNHVAQILLSHDSVSDAVQEQSYWSAAPAAWPELRDVVHIALGILGFLMIRFFLRLITGMA
jgi:hypothetical protein